MSKPYKLAGWKKGSRKPEDFPEDESDRLIQDYIDAGFLQVPVWRAVEEPSYLQKKIIISYVELRASGKRATYKEIAQYLFDHFDQKSPRLDESGKEKPLSERWIGYNVKQLKEMGYIQER